MGNEYLDSYERAKRADRERRSHARQMKRRRQKRLKMIKGAITAAVAVVVAVCCILYTTCGEGGGQADGIDSQQMAQDAMQALAQISEPEQKFKYPSISENYKEIVSEEVKSPYVALLDVENSQVIAGRGYNEKIYPASMTKVMTLIVAVEQLQDLNRTYALSYELLDPLVREQASRAGFDPGEMVTAKDYLYGLVLPSGADAAVALSIMTAGSEEAFADLMNQKCSEIGLKNTHFMNASGLYDEQQYTTPVEMAMIMQYAMQNPTCAEVLSTYQYTTTPTAQHPEGIKLSSTMFSRMYGNEVENVTIMAGKTGYTQEAGNCLVSYAQKNGHHYVALTAGASYKWHVIFDDVEITDRQDLFFTCDCSREKMINALSTIGKQELQSMIDEDQRERFPIWGRRICGV